VFELPPEFATAATVHYELLSPYEEQRVRRVRLVAGRATELHLAPYEVLSFAGAAFDD
jgi:hypothetical protein